MKLRLSRELPIYNKSLKQTAVAAAKKDEGLIRRCLAPSR